MNSKGFSLVEVLATLAIAGIVSAGIYGVYIAQNRSYVVQSQVVETQQDIRFVKDIVAKDVRLAGLQDPRNKVDTPPGFIDPTNATSLHLTMDRTGGEGDGTDNDGDGTVDEPDEAMYPDGAVDDVGEEITYTLDGTKLVRSSNGVDQILADNIEQLEFYYTLKDGSQTTTPAETDFEDIRSVQVAILARTEHSLPASVGNPTFTSPSGVDWTPAGNDGYRRRMLVTTVRCRNLGL